MRCTKMRAARKNTLLHAHLILLLGLARASISRLCLCEWDMDSKQNMGINWIRAPKNDPKLVTLLSFFGMDQTRCGRPRKSWTIAAIWGSKTFKFIEHILGQNFSHLQCTLIACLHSIEHWLHWNQLELINSLSTLKCHRACLQVWVKGNMCALFVEQ